MNQPSKRIADRFEEEVKQKEGAHPCYGVTGVVDWLTKQPENNLPEYWYLEPVNPTEYGTKEETSLMHAVELLQAENYELREKLGMIEEEEK